MVEINVLKSTDIDHRTMDNVLELFDLGYGEKADYSPFIRMLAKDKNPAPLTWKMNDFPKDASRSLAALAMDDDKVVGFYAFMTRPAKIGDCITDLAQAMDSVVHPEYQGQGIYGNIVKTLNHALYDQTGIQLFYAFPNLNNPRVRSPDKFYSKIIVPTPRIVKDRIETNSVSLSALDSSSLYNKQESILRIWDKMAQEFDWAPVKSASYLEWRYLNNPHNGACYNILGLGDASLEGIAVTKLYNDTRNGVIRGHIVDLISSSPGTTEELVAGAENYLKQMGATDCSLFMFPGTHHMDVLEKRGYVQMPLDAKFVMGSANNMPLKLTEKNILYLQQGDDDVF